MKYLELKHKHEKEITDFPIFFAYNNDQFSEGLRKLNVQKTDVIEFMNGGFIRRADIEKFKSMLSRFSEEMDDLFRDKEALVEALVYELNNREYCYAGDYAWDETDAVEALGLDPDNDYHAACIKEAIAKVQASGCE